MSNIEKRTIDQLVNTFGFTRNRAREAVAAIGDKSDVEMAYNWLLDHGEEDKGGAVEIRLCDHVDMMSMSGTTLASPEMFKFGKACVEGCSTGENWICLHCAQVRCSRYVKSHNMAHYKSTKQQEESALTIADGLAGKNAMGHFLAIGVQDLSIWCYECNHYVTHSKLDGIKKQFEKLKFGTEGEEESNNATQLPVNAKPGENMTDADWKSMHGHMGDPNWAPPQYLTVSDMAARPGYRTKSASEFVDTPFVMKEKVKLLAKLIKQSNNFCAYTGAGISTASGISDYASVASDSVVKTTKKKVDPWKAAPTLSHHVLTSLYEKGHLKHWINQNHDGLPEKAGYPQYAMNEIHGAWFDVSNPVVPMTGTLRDDLIKWLFEWEEKTDFCLTVGSSLCGMNSDRMVVSPSQRCIRSGQGQGSCIISLQQTQYDRLASVRIFGRSDDVMQMLASELNLQTNHPPLNLSPLKDKGNVFQIPYDSNGQLSKGSSTTLDLNVGKEVKIVHQPDWDAQRKGTTGLVVGRTDDGHYMINVGGQTRTLGVWWILHALKGEVKEIPVVNTVAPK